MTKTDDKVEFRLDLNHYQVIYYPHGIETDPVFVCLKTKRSYHEYDRFNNCPDCGDSLINCWKNKLMITPKNTDSNLGKGDKK